MAIKKVYPNGFKVWGPPYTENELLDFYKSQDSTFLTIYSDRFNPALKTPPAWLDKYAYPDPTTKKELVRKYYIAYKEKLGLKYHSKNERLAKFDTKEEAESVVNELKAQNPTFTDWEVKLHAFPS